MWLSNLWGDGPQSRRVRLAFGAPIAAAVLVDAPTVAGDASGVAFVAGIAAAATAWAAWALLPSRGGRSFLALSAVCVAAAVIVGASRWDDVAALAFPFVCVAAAAERLPTARSTAVAAVAAVSLVIAAAATGEAVDYAVAVVVACAAFTAGLAPRQQVQRAEQAELLLAESQRAREERDRAAALAERVRVAREIHDLLAHSLTALSIQLEVAQALLTEQDDPRAALERVEHSQRLVVEGIAETRRAVAALRGDSEPIRTLLPRLVDEYGAEIGATATYAVDGEPRELTDDMDVVCGRIAQEALTNVRRHAPGAPVSARLVYDRDWIALTIRNGIGSGAPASTGNGGYGLVGMRERAATLGGTLAAGADGGGWRVELRLPA